MKKEKVFYNVLALLVHVVVWEIMQHFNIEYPYAVYWLGGLSGMIITVLISEANK